MTPDLVESALWTIGFVSLVMATFIGIAYFHARSEGCFEEEDDD